MRVPRRGNPNYARRLRLANELRRLRGEAGLTGQNVRERLHWRSSSKLSRIEHGETGVKPPDLAGLLDLYGVTGEHRAELFALAEESQLAGPGPTADTGELNEQWRLLAVERDAEAIWIWEPEIFPGLFQIPAYSRAHMVGWARLFTLPPGGTDRRIEERQLRQRVLTRTPPLQLLAVIDESVLYRRVGDRAVMRDQLARVLEVSELPGVDVRILPLSGDHVITSGAFNYIKFRQIHDVPLPDRVTFEYLTGPGYADTEEVTHQYAVAFESLRAGALDQAASRTAIAGAVVRWND